MNSLKENLLDEVKEAFDDITTEIAVLRDAVEEDRISRENIVAELNRLEEMLT
jgi:hypothetical protein